ncbi:hypothetical protein F8388_019176 [Cannabis sativa]|uniref:RNase H type-1 domain-containing protein n=1 Tax=Cannabis sativa TaxID=3483 RepID=A0A7J6EBF6_CANSA|nr:hypothetical protein F8388_019176 [Cannabis sativa]
MFAQTTFGSPSFPYPFMHSISILFFRWRRIIALWLGRRGSRPPAAQMAHVSPHLPGYTYFSYKDALRAPAKSIYKKSIFELSNSIPFEEQPSLTNLDHHSLQDQTNRFLATTTPTTFPVTVASSPSPNFIQHTTAPTSNITYSSQPQTVHPTLHCSLPTHPIMTTTTLPTTSKGKAPMYPQPSLVSLNSPPLSSLNINDSPAAPSSTRKSHCNSHGYFTFSSPPIFAEDEALHRALLWCQAVRFPIAVIASDCQNLVHRIQKFSPDRSALSGLVALIVSSLSYFPGAVVHHIHRSTNTTAHDLARSALGTDKEIIWNHFSSSP